jgi:hypothetical protein
MAQALILYRFEHGYTFENSFVTSVTFSKTFLLEKPLGYTFFCNHYKSFVFMVLRCILLFLEGFIHFVSVRGFHDDFVVLPLGNILLSQSISHLTDPHYVPH